MTRDRQAAAIPARQSRSTQRARDRNKERLATGRTPSSPITRGTCSLLVGSTQRANAICLKPSSPPTASPGPRRSYAPDNASHNRAQRLESTTAPATQAPAPRDSRSRAACPDSAVILSRPARTRTAGPASSWAEPRCSTIRRTPCSLATICTAVAPEAVRTFRTNGLTPPPYNHPLVPRTHHPDRTTPTKNPHHDATSPKLARVRRSPAGSATAKGPPRGWRTRVRYALFPLLRLLTLHCMRKGSVAKGGGAQQRERGVADDPERPSVDPRGLPWTRAAPPAGGIRAVAAGHGTGTARPGARHRGLSRR